MNVYHDEIHNSKLFAGLNSKEIDEILREAKPVDRKFQRGDILWREGDMVDGIGLLVNGTLLCQRYHADGKVQLVRLFTTGDILNVEAGVSHRQTSPVFVVAANAGDYLWFPNESLLRNPEIVPAIIATLQANLLAYLADDTIRFMNKSDILSRRTVRGRVVIYLNVLREKHGDEVDIGMSQEEFAQYLCVDRSSLSEELNKMRREGLIDFNKKSFKIMFTQTQNE